MPEFEAEHWKDVKTLVVPDDWKFSQIREFIAKQDGDPRHVCIDDDLYMYRRRLPASIEDTKLLDLTPGDAIALWNWIESKFDRGYVHGAISPREGNNYAQQLEEECTRAMRFHFYRADALRDLKFSFMDTPGGKQDFHMTLTLIEYGLPNIVSFEFAQNQDNYSNERGGCDWYRTVEKMEADAIRLAELHPHGVGIVEKFTEKAWGGGIRKDVRCRWKKSLGIKPLSIGTEEAGEVRHTLMWRDALGGNEVHDLNRIVHSPSETCVWCES